MRTPWNNPYHLELFSFSSDEQRINVGATSSCREAWKCSESYREWRRCNSWPIVLDAAPPRMPLCRLSGNPSSVPSQCLSSEPRLKVQYYGWDSCVEWNCSLVRPHNSLTSPDQIKANIHSQSSSFTYCEALVNAKMGHKSRCFEECSSTKMSRNLICIYSHVRKDVWWVWRQWCDRYWFLHVTWLIVK